MFIDGLKAIPDDGREPRLWKFRNPQGAYKHLCVLGCDADEAALIKQAISYALFGGKSRLKSVLLALTDDNGDSWIFERSEASCRVLKNRQLLDARSDAPQRELFADYLPLDPKASFSWTEMSRAFELSATGLDIIAETESGRVQRKSSYEQATLERSAQLKQSIERVWGKNLDFALFEKLLPVGEACYRRYASFQDQKKTLGKIFSQLDQLDAQLMKKIEQELDIIDQIRRIAEPLMAAGKSPKNWHDKMHQVEQEKLRVETEIQEQAMPIPEGEIDWAQVLQVLTRSLACDRLEKTARASLAEAKDKIAPVYEAHRTVVQGFLAHDQELLKTFEACLYEIDASLHRSLENQRGQGNIAHKLNKLLGFNPAEPLKLKASYEPEAEDGLADARVLVNQCLGHIAQLYTQLDESASQHEEKLGDFQARYDLIAAECLKAKEQWATLAASLGLDPNTTVSHLILSINLYGQLSALRAKSQKLADDYGDYRSNVRSLVTLIESWRSHTGSQKSLALDHPNVVLAEAKGVMSYADKKLAQVKKLRAIEAQIEAYRLMKARLEQDEERVALKWQAALEEIGLPARPLGTDDLGLSFEWGRELLQFESLRKQTQKALKNEHIFAENVFDAPLVYYSWTDTAVSNKTRLQLLQLIEQSQPHGWALILCKDEALVDMMQKMGLSYAQRVEAKPAADKASTQEPARPAAPAPAKPLISDKARSALEIFAAKQGGGPR